MSDSWPNTGDVAKDAECLAKLDDVYKRAIDSAREELACIRSRITWIENNVEELAEHQTRVDFAHLRRDFAMMLAHCHLTFELSNDATELDGLNHAAIAKESHDLATECTRVWSELDKAVQEGE